MPLGVFRNPTVDLAPMKNESVLFQPQTNKFCLLNVTAAFVWDQLGRSLTVPELAQILCDNFDGVSFPDAVRDVKRIVDELLALECLQSSRV